MPKLVFIPILDATFSPKWDCEQYAHEATSRTYESFSAYMYYNGKYVIDDYDIHEGDIVVPECSYLYKNALQLGLDGKTFISTAYDVGGGFVIGCKQIPTRCSDPVKHFSELLEDANITLELATNVSYCDGEYKLYDTETGHFSRITKWQAAMLHAAFIMTQ